MLYDKVAVTGLKLFTPRSLFGVKKKRGSMTRESHRWAIEEVEKKGNGNKL